MCSWWWHVSLCCCSLSPAVNVISESSLERVWDATVVTNTLMSCAQHRHWTTPYWFSVLVFTTSHGWPSYKGLPLWWILKSSPWSSLWMYPIILLHFNHLFIGCCGAWNTSSICSKGLPWQLWTVGLRTQWTHFAHSYSVSDWWHSLFHWLPHRCYCHPRSDRTISRWVGLGKPEQST